MIVSHRHKFIFLKTVKTAGTSVEVALSKICGPEDILTELAGPDEELRRRLGYRTAQNYAVDFGRWTPGEKYRALRYRQRPTFENHTRASYARAKLGSDMWDTYLKFSIERNPWDKMVSWYFWTHPEEPRPSIDEFVQSNAAAKLEAFDIYSVNNEVAADRMLRFESLSGDFGGLLRDLGIDEEVSLPQTKNQFRSDRRSYRDLLSPESRRRVEILFAREIQLWDYVW